MVQDTRNQQIKMHNLLYTVVEICIKHIRKAHAQKDFIFMSRWVSRFLHPARHNIGYFGDGLFYETLQNKSTYTAQLSNQQHLIKVQQLLATLQLPTTTSTKFFHHNSWKFHVWLVTKVSQKWTTLKNGQLQWN